ncbi:ComEC/Rec2 family competence protein [Photobacterium kishitanii]|uniref:ComEC/Rec2 family competence protein n=1 Tax=Photobacterium kishitanii TaxID=318456 RepID=UPI000D15AA5D|nr:MBL fold metallo-hydrolase [Photobacterium kishitanii]PSU23834.1 MBL fold metallo-hydrolase [Photobacterium kishitanii]
MSVVFYSFGALHGDAFLVSSENTSILIDGGMPGTYGEIKRKIKDIKVDAVFITHVDQDHIGGIVKLIADDDLDLSNCTFYMNHPDLMVFDDSNLVAYHHGDTLKDFIEKRNLKIKSVSIDNSLTIGDFSVDILSPTEDDVTELHKNWDASRVMSDGQLSYIERQYNNGDIINRSSIAKLVKCNNTSILLLADSYSNIVVSQLNTRGYNSDTPIVVDLVKLSHHGSKHNTSKELLSIISCSNYYISTNGSKYGHPDVETIFLLQEKAKKNNSIYNIFLNYNIGGTIKSKCGIDLPNLNFIHKKDVNLPI